MTDREHETRPSAQPQGSPSAFREADAAASVAHDFVFGRNGVTKEEASDAIWRVHHALRPLIARDLRAGITARWAAGIACVEVKHDRPGRKRVYLRLEMAEAKKLCDELAAVIGEREA